MTFFKTFFTTLFLAQAASASTVAVTFSYERIMFGPGFANVGISDGFSYDFSDVYLDGNYLGLHDDSGILSSEIKPLSGAPFTPQRIDVFGYSKLYRTGPGPAPTTGDVYDDFAWATSGVAPLPELNFIGLRGGRTVAQQGVGPMAWDDVNFSPKFSNIDSLLLELEIPGNPPQLWSGGAPGSNALWCDEWCAEFQVDNLIVQTSLDPGIAPVPLPASGLLLGGAVLALGAWRRRQRERC